MNTNTCRLLLTKKCNFSCTYCCNNLPEVSSKFCSIKREHLRNIKHRYEVFNLTGGEIGLIKPLVRDVIEFLRCNYDPRIYLYTNRLFDLDYQIAHRIAGINIGCHDNIEYVLARAKYYSRFIDIEKIRIHIEDIKIKPYNPNSNSKSDGYIYPELQEFNQKIWTRNQCETNEDIFVLEE